MRDLTQQKLTDLPDTNPYGLALRENGSEKKKYQDKLKKATQVIQKTEEEYEFEDLYNEAINLYEFFEDELEGLIDKEAFREELESATHENIHEISEKLQKAITSGQQETIQTFEDNLANDPQLQKEYQKVFGSLLRESEDDTENEDVGLNDWYETEGKAMFRKAGEFELSPEALERHREMKRNRKEPIPLGEDPDGLWEQEVERESRSGMGSRPTASRTPGYNAEASDRTHDRSTTSRATHAEQTSHDHSVDEAKRRKEQRADLYQRANKMATEGGFNAGKQKTKGEEDVFKGRFFDRRNVTFKSFMKDCGAVLRTRKARIMMKVGAMVSMQTMMGMMSRDHEFDNSKQMFAFIGMTLGVFWIAFELSQDGVDSRALRF